jgi:YVTN family beta-propeller protein
MRSNVLAAMAALAALITATRPLGQVSAQTAARFAGPTSSQPLALSADDSLLLVANPDNNTVTLFDAKNGNARLAEIPVGKEPNGVALSPDGSRAYVANTVDGTVSVLSINRNTPGYYTSAATIPVGTEPTESRSRRRERSCTWRMRAPTPYR